MPFIVLEGLDGAGKSTQVKLLRQYLNERNITFRYLHFPRFDAPVYGELIARFLRGELGAVDAVDPYLVALLYAGGRADAAPLIRAWLDAGDFILVDRYVYSNVAYQCAKIADDTEREKLRDWIVELEYTHNRIPKPDISIFLDVPFSFTRKSLESNREGDDREYLKGKADIHELSLGLQEKVRQVYLEQAGKDAGFRVVSCHDDAGQMLPPECIFRMIRAEIKQYDV